MEIGQNKGTIKVGGHISSIFISLFIYQISSNLHGFFFVQLYTNQASFCELHSVHLYLGDAYRSVYVCMRTHCCLKVALSECCIKVNEANYCVRYIPFFFIYPKGVVACNGKKFNYSRIMKTLMLSSDSKYN